MIVYVVTGFGILVPIREIFKRVVRDSVSDNRVVEYLKRKSDKIIYKVVIVRFLLEGCIEMGTCAMCTVIVLFKSVADNSSTSVNERRRNLNLSDRWTNAEIVSNTCAVLTLIGLIASPFYLYRAAKKYFTRKKEEEVEKKYGQLFENLSSDSLP